MFETLSEKLQKVFQRLSGRGRLTERDVDEALREVRIALLEADVHFRVARDFVARIRERAIGHEVLESLSPGQQVIKIVHEELIALLGPSEVRLRPAPQPPSIVMLVGLQGSGKTTAVAKLGLYLRRQNQRPLLVAADPYRPAAVDQLALLGQQTNLPVHTGAPGEAPETTARNALAKAREGGHNWVLIDTAGRLHIDDEMMAEIVRLKELVHPSDVLLVADAMTGQDAVRSAEAFHKAVGLTGVILTKMDGDARGGAALSIRAVTGVPILFIGTGEKPDAFEPFYADRIASRILGMGDVLTLIERAQEAADRKKAEELERKLRRGQMDLNDLLDQLRTIQRMGPLQQVMEMIPGFSQLRPRLAGVEPNEKHLKRMEAIILSMTPEERAHPDIIDGSRRRRIARGSGTSPQEVNQLLNQFREMQKLMKALSQGRGGLGSLFRLR